MGGGRTHRLLRLYVIFMAFNQSIMEAVTSAQAAPPKVDDEDDKKEEEEDEDESPIAKPWRPLNIMFEVTIPSVRCCTTRKSTCSPSSPRSSGSVCSLTSW